PGKAPTFSRSANTCSQHASTCQSCATSIPTNFPNIKSWVSEWVSNTSNPARSSVRPTTPSINPNPPLSDRYKQGDVAAALCNWWLMVIRLREVVFKHPVFRFTRGSSRQLPSTPGRPPAEPQKQKPAQSPSFLGSPSHAPARRALLLPS